MWVRILYSLSLDNSGGIWRMLVDELVDLEY